jgi:putative SOS response-associated peptidase YedK
MVFAGIWAARQDPETGEWHRTCSILTTDARGVIADIHDRMPVSLPEEVWDAWLDRDLTDSETALSLLRSIEDDLLMEHPVSKRVNSVRNDGPELRDVAQPETLF